MDLPTEFILLRHGESEGNAQKRFGGHGPTRLTPLGHLQAEAAAQALARGARRLDAIYVSDLPRAVETAAPVARATGLVAKETPALRERSVGHLTGLSFEEAQTLHPDTWAGLLRRDPDFCPPGGESHRMCSARVGALLAELLPLHAGQRVLLVSHGVTIDHLVRHFLGTASEAELRYIIHVDNCSLHRVQRRGGDGHPWRIVCLNDISHLAAVGTAPDPRATS